MLRWPRRAEALDAEDEYLLGRDLLAAPVLEPGQSTRRLWLPPGRWVDWWRSVRFDPATRAFTLRRARVLRGGRYVEAPAPLGRPPLLCARTGPAAAGPRRRARLSPYASGGRPRRRHRVGMARGSRVRLPAGRPTNVELWTARRPAAVRVDGRRVPFGYRRGVLRAAVRGRVMTVSR